MYTSTLIKVYNSKSDCLQARFAQDFSLYSHGDTMIFLDETDQRDALRKRGTVYKESQLKSNNF